MKTKLVLSIFLFSIIFNSCSIDEIETQVEETQRMQASIGGNLKILDGGAFVINYDVEADLITLYGAKNNYNILLKFNSSITTQELFDAQLIIGTVPCIFNCDNPPVYHQMESGTITLSEFTDTKIKGAFEFVSVNVNTGNHLAVTSGSFDIKY